MKALLLAGGKGTRLWPLSTSHTPKQLLSPLGGEKNLLQMTLERIQNLGFENPSIHLVTLEDQCSLLERFWNPKNLGAIITEPVAKNTGPAILLAAKYLMEHGTEAHEAIYTFPTDQYMKDFTLNSSLKLDDMILCFRITPTRAEEGYGYVQAHTGGVIRKIRSFKEKPDKKIAEMWYQSWIEDPEGPQEEKYFWNSGIYGFTLNSLGCALEKINPSLYQFWKNSSYQEFLEHYSELPKESFDYMIAEHAYNLHSAPLSASTWRDIGSWESIHEALRKNLSDNINLGQETFISTDNTTGCLTFSDKKVNIACADVENLAVIISGDNILITEKNNPQAVQKLISELQKKLSDF